MFKDYLWTPWRMEYMNQGKAGKGQAASGSPNQTPVDGAKSAPQSHEERASTGCVFCDKLQAGPEHDRDNLILERGRRNFVILNLFPYNSGHLMVVPYEHTADYTALDEETTAEMTALLQKMIRTIKAEYEPEGFNMGMNLGKIAGAGVADHVHMHVVPRWAGDVNFMPIVGATRVMPELLETTYDRLKACLASQD